MKIIYKLTLGYLIVSLLVVFVAYFGIISVNHINSAYSEISEQTLPILDRIEEVEAEGQNIISSTNKVVLITGTKGLGFNSAKEEIDQLKTHRIKFDEAISEYEELADKYFPEEKVLVENIKNSSTKIEIISDELIVLEQQGASEEKILENWKEFQLAEKAFRKDINEIFQHETIEVNERNENIQYAISTSLRNILFLSLLTFAVAMITGFFISRNISKPINILKNAALDIGNGKFDTRVDIRYGDEVGVLANAFNLMAKKINQNITDLENAKKTIELHSRFSRTVIDSLTDALSVIDVSDFKIRDVNRVFLETYRLKKEDVIGKTCYEITHNRTVPCSPPDDVCPLVETVKTGKPSTEEHVHCTMDGGKRYVEVTASPMKDEKGNLISIIHITRDITDRKNAEQIRHENERLISANRIKNDFLSAMSHELRTPLNSVLGFSELLKQKRVGGLNEKQERYVDNILTGGKRQLNLIDMILDMTRLEAGKLELIIKKIYVPDAIKDVLILVKQQSEEHKVTVKTEIDPALENIFADEQRFKLIMFNLLDNAMKFSKPEGGNVVISSKKEGNMAKFSVSDNSIGISEENVGKLFVSFKQVDSGIARKYGGLGLGLAIVKQLVELHGGTIKVDSKIGEGSTFTFSIPIEAKKMQAGERTI